MSYLVIARKWRPSLFEEVVGQGHVTRTLKNALASKRIAHAYLFAGARGVGKTTTARILAKGLNCENGPTPTPCNACRVCLAITAGSSVDVFEIDGASNTGVENIRELRENVKFVPADARYKVYIIDEVHMLSTAAFNALLKTLEEPPPHVVFVFATTEVHKIPATILSRCQRFDFRRIPFKEIHAQLARIALKEGIEVEEQALYLITREAEGSLRDGQSLLDQAIAFAGTRIRESDVALALGLMDRALLYGLMTAVLRKDPNACLNVVEKIYDFGYDLKKACVELIEAVRDITVLKVTGDASLLDLPQSEIETLRDLAEGVGAERLEMLFAMLSRSYEDIARSAQPRFSLEMALLRALHLDELKSVGELMAGLAALKERIAASRHGGPEGPLEGVKAKTTATAKATEIPAPEPEGRDASGLMGRIRACKDAALINAMEKAAISLDGQVVEVVAPADLAGFIDKMKREKLETLCRDYLKAPVSMKVRVMESGEKDDLVDFARTDLGGRVIEDKRS